MILGALTIAWQTGWIKITSRNADVAVTAEVVRSSSKDQLVIKVKNVGTVELILRDISIEAEEGASFSITEYGVRLSEEERYDFTGDEDYSAFSLIYSSIGEGYLYAPSRTTMVRRRATPFMKNGRQPPIWSFA